MLACIPTEDGGHFYQLSGKRIPGVSEIMMLAGLIDFGNAPEANIQKARERGKLGHLAAEELDRHGSRWGFHEPELEPYLTGYELFKNDLKFKPDYIETPMCDPILKYAGTVDRTGTVVISSARKDEPVTVELKFTYEIADTAGIQLAAYNPFFPDSHRRKRLVVRLRNNGKYQLQWCDEVESSYNDSCVFQAALSTAKWKDRKRKLGIWG